MNNGILIIDKPAGMTSHDVVNRVRKIFKTKRVGHTGTLDPEATGVMVVCVGNGLRVAEYLSAEQKQYLAEVTFGIETDTQDIWGVTGESYDASGLTEADIAKVLPQFRGTINQIPPMVSAVRVEGKHLYELAREGVTVKRMARPVTIIQLDLIRFTAGTRPIAELDVCCSTGTYIRTLAYDIGRSLGVGAAMSALRRTRVGSAECGFNLTQAHTLDQLSELAMGGSSALEEVLLPPISALNGWPRILVDETLELRIRNGQHLMLNKVEISGNERADSLVAVLDLKYELIAVAKITGCQTVQPVKVMRRD
jgi:tRNA pseudouridine55 synthase